MWEIPLFDLNYDSWEEEAVLRSRRLTTGERTQEFEEQIASFLGKDSVVWPW